MRYDYLIVKWDIKLSSRRNTKRPRLVITDHHLGIGGNRLVASRPAKSNTTTFTEEDDSMTIQVQPEAQKSRL